MSDFKELEDFAKGEDEEETEDTEDSKEDVDEAEQEAIDEEKKDPKEMPMGKGMLQEGELPEDSLLKSGPYIGPRGGKYKDADHKVAWIDEHGKPDPKALDKLSGDIFGKLTPKKEIDRMRAEDSKKPDVHGGDIGDWSKQAGKLKQKMDSAEKTARSHPRGTSERSGANVDYMIAKEDHDKHQSKRPGNVKKSMEATMTGIEELEEFAKGDALPKGTPTIGGSGEEQGESSLAGKGKTSGSTDSGNNEEINAPGCKKEKLSEDDEKDEKQMKPHKKPLEKTAKSGIAELNDFAKGGPYIGPRGGKWADAKHSIPWKEGGGGKPKGTNNAKGKSENMKKFEGFKKVNSGSTFYGDNTPFVTYAKYDKNNDGPEYTIVHEKNGKQALLDDENRIYTENEDLEDDIIRTLRDKSVATKPPSLYDYGKDKPKETKKSLNSADTSPQGQRDSVAREHAIAVSRLQKGEDDVSVGYGIAPTPQEPEELEKGTTWNQGEDSRVEYSSQADLEATRLIKGDDFYCHGEPTLLRSIPITHQVPCPACKSSMSKALTACPSCGHGSIQHRIIPGVAISETPLEKSESTNAPPLRPAIKRDIDCSGGVDFSDD